MRWLRQLLGVESEQQPQQPDWFTKLSCRICDSFKQDKDFTLLLLGQTGAGKTSLLELLANLRNFADFDAQGALDTGHLLETLRPLHDSALENAVEDKMASKTSDASIYRINVSADVHVTVIDTPGFGDSRGFEEDELHVRRILDRLEAHNHVHCVVLVINGREARMTGTIKYVLAQLTSIMPECVLNHLHIVFTNCEDQTRCNFELSALQEYGIKQPSCVYIENTYCVMSKLLNSGCDDQEEGHYRVRKALEGAKESGGAVAKMLSTIRHFPAVHTKKFVEVHGKKEEVERCMATLIEQMASKVRMIGQIANLEKLIEDGYAPESESITETTAELVYMDANNYVVCMHPGCKTNAGQIPDQVMQNALGLGLGIGITVIACACPIVWAGAAVSAEALLAGRIAVAGVGAFVSWVNGEEPCKKCGKKHHQVGHYRWEENAEVHRVVTPAALAAAKNAEERAKLTLTELKRQTRNFQAEEMALRVQLGKKLEEYQELGIAKSYQRMLWLQLQGVRERIQGASPSEDIGPMKAFEGDLLNRLRAAEKASDWECPICWNNPQEVVYECGHGTCRRCHQTGRWTRCHTCRRDIGEVTCVVARAP